MDHSSHSSTNNFKGLKMMIGIIGWSILSYTTESQFASGVFTAFACQSLIEVALKVVKKVKELQNESI